MKAKSLLVVLLAFLFLGSTATSFSGCCWWDDSTDYSSLTFDQYVDLFAEAFVDNDLNTARWLKANYPGFYQRMLNNLDYNSKNMSKSQEDRNLAALFYAWAVLVD